jgi:hypothetical protein
MNKSDAIHRMVEQFQAIPRSWAETICEKLEEYHTLPMWGTMFIVDDWYGERLMQNSTIQLESGEDGYNEEMDSEMIGEHRINDTNAYIYEIDEQYVIGIHGAGWDFYDGIWDTIYEIMELEWHEHEHNFVDGECTGEDCYASEPKKIFQIVIEGGCLRNVDNLPEGWDYELIDLDEKAGI